MASKPSYTVGTEVVYRDRPALIVAQQGLQHVRIQYKDDGETDEANVIDLAFDLRERSPKSRPVDSFSEKDMETARRNFAAIEPLLELTHGIGKAIAARAKELGVGQRTLRRWLQIYRGRYILSDLAPDQKRKRKRRLSKNVETIIQDVIERIYLNKQRASQKRVIDEVARLCRQARVKAPHPNTVRARIQAISDKEKTKRRHGAKAARDKHAAVEGPFPHGNFPLEVAQIDHTLLDIELVDDDTRLPIGRPWLTVAIDVYSRMILGFYISLDAPSAFSVGMCIRHAALPKDAELLKHDIKGEWPTWGLMRTLHADNGKDFRSQTIKKACEEYGITMEWRPVRQPHFGGHVERLMGTLATEIHALPGTTFSNVKERGEYNSAKRSAMTLEEFHRWLLQLIVGKYHNRIHSGIGMPPIEKWREGIIGTDRKKGTGLPAPVTDPERFAIDFLPYIERTVQREGIAWDGIRYFSPEVRHWVGEKKGGRTAKFVVRRDPRDISKIYFLDPELEAYVEVPYRETWHPSMTLWEYRAARKVAKERGESLEDKDAVFRAHEEMQRITSTAVSETRKARRNKQRKKQHTPGEETVKPALQLVVDNASDEGEFELSDEDLEGEWEEWT
tara:strand:+ start:843 stop:2699 length:1857 start_codon:yes stop_codon:yes gene_type:complete